MPANKLLDAVIEKMGLKNDAALCRGIGVSPPVISKIRSKRIPLGPSIMLRLHEFTNLSTKELKDFMTG